MDISLLGIAIASYLTGAVVIYAYMNRNRHIDLVLAAGAMLSFGTSKLFQGFSILPAATNVLSAIAEGLTAGTVLFLTVRIARGVYAFIGRYFN